MNGSLVIALIAGFGGLGAGLAALFTMGAQRRKISADGSKAMAEATQIVVDSATKLLTPAEARADRLEAKLTKAEGRIDELEASLAEANRTVIALTDHLKVAQGLMTENGIAFPFPSVNWG